MSLQPSPMKGEDLINLTGMAEGPAKNRAKRLAIALGGRWVPNSQGWHVRPATGRRWVALMEAGFDAKKIYRPDLRWVYSLKRGQWVGLARALEVAAPADVETVEVEW